MQSALKPIVYEGLVDIRFADLDPYGHVNSKHYVDLVSTVRLNFLAREMKTPISQVTGRGIGFYLTQSLINYKRPIVGLQRVKASSYVEEIREGKSLIIPFSITSENGANLYSDGVLDFAIIDLKTQRSTVAPAWLIELFLAESK